MKSIIITIIFLVSTSIFAQDTYRDTMKEYLVVTNSKKTVEMMLDQLFANYQIQYSDLSEDFWNSTKEEMMTSVMDEFIDMLLPIYKKQLSEDDLKAIIEFFKSPAGVKYSEKTPILTQESMQAGQTWGMQLAEKIMTRINNELDSNKNK